MTDARDAYAILQVRADADYLVVQAAYRALARCYHSDGTAPNAARMTEINRAWELLRTPERRASYDRSLNNVAVAVGPGRAARPAVPPEPFDPWRDRAPAARGADDVLDFGRYEGWRIADLVRHDPDYVRWLSRHSTGVRFLEAIARCLPGETGLGRRGALVG